jgi:hypothetical protein
MLTQMRRCLSLTFAEQGPATNSTRKGAPHRPILTKGTPAEATPDALAASTLVHGVGAAIPALMTSSKS